MVFFTVYAMRPKRVGRELELRCHDAFRARLEFLPEYQYDHGATHQG